MARTLLRGADDWRYDAPVDISNTLLPTWIVSLSTFGALIVALLAVAFTIRQHRSAREAFVQTMRSEWRNLQDSWARILLAKWGSDFHYADATPEVRAKSKQLAEDGMSDKIEVSVTAAQTLRMDVRPVTRFVSYAADSVIRGRWTISEAYDVLGPDIARHHKTIRALSHKENESDWFLQATEFNTFDEHDCVYLFAHLLRAEQCRRGDTYGHFAVELAEEMRGSNRMELRRSIRRAKRVRHRIFLPLRVQMLLYRGRHPRVASAYALPEEPIIPGSKRRLFRRPMEPMNLTRARILLSKRQGGYK